MKTFQEIADEIGVSKQAVYKRYRGKLYKSVLPYARMVGGTTYIMEQGECIIKQDFASDSALARTHPERVQDTLILMLQKELKAKTSHIEELAGIIREQARIIKTLTKPKSKKRKTPTKQLKMSAPLERHIEKK